MWERLKSIKCPIWLFDVFFIFLIVILNKFFYDLTLDFRVHNSKIALTLFTVQASVSVLGIAVLSLLASSVKETYLGIKLSTYFIEYQSAIFKSRYVIPLQLILVIVDLFLISINRLEWIPFILIFSIMLTIRQVISVLGIFRSYQYISLQIEQYYQTKLKNANKRNISQIFESIESSDDYVSIYNSRKHVQSVLRFYLSLQELINIDNYSIIGSSFENSFSNYVKKYIDNSEISTLNDAFGIVTDAIKNYTDKGIVSSHFAISLLDNFQEILEFSNNKDIVELNRIIIFYKAYLENLRNLDKEEKFEIALEVDVLLIRYLYLVFNKNSNFKGITKDALKSITSGIHVMNYHNLDTLPFQREMIIWLLLSEVEITDIEEILESLIITSEKNLSQFSKTSSFHFIAIMIFWYQIMFISNDGLLKVASLKKRIINLIESNNEISVYIFHLMYDSDEIQNLDIESIRKVISRWEFVTYKESDSRDYFIDKSIAEFILLLLSNSNMTTQRISEILVKLKISGYTMEKLLGSNDLSSSTDKIRNFQQIFLKIDEKPTDEVYKKISMCIDDVMKIEYLNRHMISIDNEFETRFISENIDVLTSSINNSLKSLSGRVPDDVETLVFKRNLIDDLENCGLIFKQFWVEHLINQFKIEVVRKSILSKVHKRKVRNNKATTIKEVLNHVKRVRVRTDTIIGYKRNFYGYENSSEYTEFLNQLKNKIEIDNNSHIILAIDSSLICINIESVNLIVLNASLVEFTKSNSISQHDTGLYYINVGLETKVQLTKNEIESYVDRRIRKISVEVKYKIYISKDKIGNFIEFEK